MLNTKKCVEGKVLDGEAETDLPHRPSPVLLLFLKPGWCRRVLKNGVRNSIHGHGPGTWPGLSPDQGSDPVSEWKRLLVQCPPSCRGNTLERYYAYDVSIVTHFLLFFFVSSRVKQEFYGKTGRINEVI